MLNGIAQTNQFFYDLNKKIKRPNLNYILSNLRMSICELG